MAYGDVTSTTSTEPTATTAHTVSLPTLKNNDFLVMTFDIVNNTGDIATTPTGWTKEHRHAVNNKNMYVFTRRANGGEGSTVEITTSASVVTAHTCMAVEKAKKNNRSADGEDAGSDTMAAGAFSPGEAGVDPYLVLVTYTAWAGASPGTITAWPSAFTLGRVQTNQTGQGVSICATPLQSTDSTAKSHTKSTSLAWVAGALSLIEDTSDPPTAPQPHAKSLLWISSRCTPPTFVKNNACTGLLTWCTPERDGDITLRRTGETDYTLTTDAGSITLNGEDLDFIYEICGKEILENLSIANCTYEGYDFTLTLREGTYQQVIGTPGGCSSPSSITVDFYISRNSGGPSLGDIVYSFDYNVGCAGQYSSSAISLYLGNWRERTVFRNAANTITYADCYRDADWYLKNDVPAVQNGWYLRVENEISSGEQNQCTSGTPFTPACRARADTNVGITEGLFWPKTETPRSCPSEIVPT